MIRKVAGSFSLLLVAVLLMFAAACGSDTAQEEGGEKGGSPSEKKERAAAAGEGTSQQSGSSEGGGEQPTNIGRTASVVVNGSSYVSPLTEIFGDVFIGQDNFVAASSVLRASPGHRVELGDKATVQDNIVVRALNKSVTIGDESNLGHHAIVRDSQIGNSAYIGYNTEIEDSKIGNGALVYHGARVEGVEIPDDAYVASGEVVTEQAAADDLPTIEEVGVDEYYQEALLDIHDELTKGYIELFEKDGYQGLLEVGPNPETSFNPEQTEPQLGENVELQEFVRVVGDVRVGENSSVGRRTAIRADEGSPMVIGPGAIIEDRVTFHAVKGTDVRAGEFLVVDDDAVLHGPLEIGDENVIGEHAVVFRARLGDNVRVGEGAIIVGPEGPADKIMEIPDGTVIPVGAVVTTQEDVEKLQG
jgi:carbonic anhydrase/acetyltransferase-like protein (isoleucine patch superfamily)